MDIGLAFNELQDLVLINEFFGDLLQAEMIHVVISGKIQFTKLSLCYVVDHFQALEAGFIDFISVEILLNHSDFIYFQLLL